ncbi:MAG TPA: DUF6305 family protein [Clostridia bacterium]|nr:DUF6305 family protein [Clostridia bacterium]
MKQKFIRAILLATLIILLILTNMPFTEKSETKIFTLPGLPRPIANTPVIITSAGQSTDTYIIRDISNQLMIRSFFMPQARDVDLKDIKTIVFVVGYSSLGAKLQGISYEEEKLRIEKLLQKAKEDKLTVLTVVIGSEQLQDNKTEELLRLIGKQTDYLVGMRESSRASILIELAKDGDIPLTLVNKVNDISEPFASAFR